MARRKITIQRNLGEAKAAPTTTKPPPASSGPASSVPVESRASGASNGSAIEQLTSGMATVDVGFKPTDQRVFRIDLNRISPDPDQPRHLMPHDLRQAVNDGSKTHAEVLRTLIKRAEDGDTTAQLILGSEADALSTDELDQVIEENGLYALARSIKEVGLRQPINVYQMNRPNSQGQVNYRIGEGERRFWAHQLLNLQGNLAFRQVKCLVEPLPDDVELIYDRQTAENAARVDLPAIARARAMNRMKDKLTLEMTREEAGKSVKPSQRAVQLAVGQRVKTFTGRTIGDRMVRNYLALLTLVPEAQDLAEAGQLTEKQLRSVPRIKQADEQVAMIKKIIAENLSSRTVAQRVKSPQATKTLKEVSRTPLELKFEKRLFAAVKTFGDVQADGEKYRVVVAELSQRATDLTTFQTFQSLHRALGDVLAQAHEQMEMVETELLLLRIIPPLESIKPYLPANAFQSLRRKAVTGGDVIAQLLRWQQEDVILDSKLHPFFVDLEPLVAAIQAGEEPPLPMVKATAEAASGQSRIYQVEANPLTYWAYELLVQRGNDQFAIARVMLLK